MNYKHYFNIILTITLALVMAFTPVLSNWPYLAYSYGTDEQQISTEADEKEVEQDQPEEDKQDQDLETESDGSEASSSDDEDSSDTAYESGKTSGSDDTEAAKDKKPASKKSITLDADDDPDGDAKDSEPVDFNLNDVVTKAEIDATKNDDGKYVIRAGTTYSIEVAFKETMSKQFPNGPQDTMTYTLPEGLMAADGDTGKFSVRVNDGGNNFTVKNNTYEVVDNKIIVRFKTDDENFDRMAAAANLTFTIAFEGEFDGENTEIIFEDEVVIDLDVDRSSILEVKKISDEQLDHSQIDYTIELRSTGVNTDIEVNDMIHVVDQNGEEIIAEDGGHQYTPDIVTIHQWGDNISFESNKRTEQDLIDLPIQIHSTGPSVINFNIPEMLDGEIIKIKYTTDVRADNIPEGDNGKVYAKAENRVSVKSNEDTTEDTSKTDSVIDYTPGIKKDVKPEGTDPGLLHWTVTANEAAKVSMAGKRITDRIADKSQKFLTYSGTGIKIDVMDENGEPVRTDSIAWDNPSITRTTNTEGKFVSWSYMIPASDIGHYKYVISYDTNVDTRGEHVNVTVSNKVDIDGNISATGKRIIGPPDGYMSISKRVLSVDLENKTIEWGIDITVPKGGLETAYVIDRHPHTGTIYEPVIEDSISVTGLYDDEGYRVNIGDKQTRIDFSYSDASGTNSGLMPSQNGESRKVSVILKTAIKDEWLENFSITSHGNAVDLNGRTSSTDNIVVEKPGLKKSVKEEPVGYRTVNGNDVPVYRYELMLSHVTKDNNTIADEFDTSVLEPYTPTADDSWYKANDAWYMYGGGTSSQTKKGGAAVSHESTESGMNITTSGTSMPHDNTDADSPKHFYARYRLVYYLTVKDSAIDSVIDSAISDSEGKYKISNNAEWEGHTGDAEIDYEYPGLTKDILTSDADLKRIDEDIPVDFKITANPSRETLNNGNDITLTDTAENLIIQPETIKIKVDGEEVHNVLYVQNGKSMVYTIPDRKKVEITYSAKVELKTIGEQGDNIKVDFNNVVDMLSYNSDVKKTASRQNTGAGVASVPLINVLKYKAGDMETKLEGAEFVLLDKNKEAVKDKNGSEVTYTTDEDGKFTVRGDMERFGWVLEENEYYYLRETKSPEGHIQTNKLYQFQVSVDGTADQDNNIYLTGGTMSIGNYPETAIDVEKVWTDGNELHSDDEITVKLQQKIGNGDWSDTIRMIDEDNNREWADVESITGVLNQDNEWKYTFDELPAVVPTGEAFDDIDTAVDYRVVETLINGKESEPVIGNSRFKETRYTTGEPDEDSDSEKKITVTNVYVPDIEISLESMKLFEHGMIDEEAKFQFIVYEVTEDGDQDGENLEAVAEGETTDIGSSESAVKFSPMKYTLEDLRNDDGGFDESRTFKYVIREVVPQEADKNGFDSSTYIQYDTKDRRATVTLRLEDDKLVADVDYGDEEEAIFRNPQKAPEITEIGVEKVWSDGNEKHDADNITVTLQQKIGDGDWSNTIRLVDLEDVYTWSDKESMTATLSKDNDWKYTFEELPVKVPTGEDFKGTYTDAKYRILETEMNGMVPKQNIDGARYKETTYDVAKADGDEPMKVTITNVYVEDVEINFEAEKFFENGTLNKDNIFKFDVSEITTSDKGEKTQKHISTASTGSGTSHKNGSKGKISFKPIKYSLEDLKKDDGSYGNKKVFRYVIKERVPSSADKNGFDSKSKIKYDTRERNVKVTLTLKNNKLEASVEYGGGEAPVFKNTRNPNTRTGDYSNIMLYVVLLGISLSAIAALMAGRRNNIA